MFLSILCGLLTTVAPINATWHARLLLLLLLLLMQLLQLSQLHLLLKLQILVDHGCSSSSIVRSLRLLRGSLLRVLLVVLRSLTQISSDQLLIQQSKVLGIGVGQCS